MISIINSTKEIMKDKLNGESFNTLYKLYNDSLKKQDEYPDIIDQEII